MPPHTKSSAATARPPAKSKAAKAGQPEPVVKFRLRITVGDSIAIGPGKIALLEAVTRTGSITAAAKTLDMSYRRAWLLLDELNRSSDRPVLDSAKGGPHGGGSIVTAEGLKLIEFYRRIEANAAKSCRADLQGLVAMLAR